MHPKLAAMINGYGPDFPNLKEIFDYQPDLGDLLELHSPIPALGRYRKNVDFLKRVTSGERIGLLRFKIIVEYFVALAELMENYQGQYADQKIITGLSSKDIAAIRKIGTNSLEVKRAELIEKFTDHDTAAASDYVKLVIAHNYPHLIDSIDGIHFANTSEDVMANVFGIIANELVFGHFMSTLSLFCFDFIRFAGAYEAEGPLILPGFTHRQAAEPITLGKKFAVRLEAIARLIRTLMNPQGNFEPFSGKLGGAVGNLTCHFAAYPDIDWWAFAKKFVSGLGLRYEEMTDQCASYVEEARIFTTVENILTQIIKLTDDFIDMASCPAQFFVKKKKVGEKGSSLMPHKSNAWAMEGAIKMLKEAQNMLHTLARELPNYPHEGDMGRSYLFRNIGNAFLPIFIGLARISGELRKYHPSPKKIQQALDEYPGMSAGSIQTILKRARISGDAYRELQEVSINKDDSYANQEEFRKNLERMTVKLDLPSDVREELLLCLNFSTLVQPVHKMAQKKLNQLELFFKLAQHRAQEYHPA